MVFFFCNDVCFTEDMFTVSGSCCGGDLDDKNSPSSYYILLLLYCMHIYVQTTFTNMYEKKIPPVFCVYIIILISKVPGHNTPP